MPFYLALDAGGTKTIGAIADDHRELARAQTGSIKRLRVESDLAHRNLEALFTELAGSQGISLCAITRTCIGTSGATVPLVANWIRETVHSLTSGELLLCGDEEIALDGAFPGGPGILVVAGTGSNVIGRARSGKIVHAGGWGPALADEGSGHWIGHEGLRTAFRALNEGRSSELLPAVMRHWAVSDLDDLLERANATPAPDFSQLTPVITSCAERGDAVAREILIRGGEELAHLALLVIKQLHGIEESPALRVAFTGSVLHHIFLVREAMIQALRRANPDIEVLSRPVDAVTGALWRARNRVGVVSTGAQ